MVLWWCFFLNVCECGPIFLVLVFVSVVLVRVAGAVALVIIVWGWSGCYLVLSLGKYSFHEFVYGCLLMFWRVA